MVNSLDEPSISTRELFSWHNEVACPQHNGCIVRKPWRPELDFHSVVACRFLVNGLIALSKFVTYVCNHAFRCTSEMSQHKQASKDVGGQQERWVRNQEDTILKFEEHAERYIGEVRLHAQY